MLPKRQRAKHTRWVPIKSTDGGDDCLMMLVSWCYFVLETRWRSVAYCGVARVAVNGDITPYICKNRTRNLSNNIIYTENRL